MRARVYVWKRERKKERNSVQKVLSSTKQTLKTFRYLIIWHIWEVYWCGIFHLTSILTHTHTHAQDNLNTFFFLVWHVSPFIWRHRKNNFISQGQNLNQDLEFYLFNCYYTKYILTTIFNISIVSLRQEMCTEMTRSYANLKEHIYHGRFNVFSSE